MANPYLQTKMRIGSCKGPIEYKSDQQVFHQDDVPEKARERKNEVKEWAKSKVLSTENHWNISNHTNPVLCERRKMENYLRDRSNQFQYNYRAESLDSLRTIEPIDKPTKFHLSSQLEKTAIEIEQHKHKDQLVRGVLKRTAEMPVNTRLAEKPEWNQRTVLQKNEYEKNHDAITRTAKTACSKMRQFTIDRATYTSPINSTIKFQDEVRRQKEEGRFDWSKLVYRDPTLDDPVDRSLLRNRYRIQGSRTFQTDQHSGIWEYNKAEGRHMWSDTGSFDYHSKGDVIKKHNPDTYNYSSPHLPDMIHTYY